MGVSTVPSGGGGLAPYYQKFTSSGTFTLPSGYGSSKPLLINIQVIGGGGSGTLGGASSVAYPTTFRFGKYSYFGDVENTVRNMTITGTAIPTNWENITNGRGGGSGGLAATQMYLTSNLTITIGAAGARIPQTATITSTGIYWTNGAGKGGTNSLGTISGESMNPSANYTATQGVNLTGGSGGTSTAGVVSATGGAPATQSDLQVGYTSSTYTWTSAQNFNSGGAVTSATWSGTPNIGLGGLGSGTAGKPAGTAGDTVPLLGALAGGSGNSTPVYGAYGIGGKAGDGATNVAADGTGGGHGSPGASGAVIITWWA
jgi:hypothetical protein